MHTRYRMMDRDGKENPEFNSVIRSGRLFQEYVCGMFYLAERMKLSWIEQHQNSIRADQYKGLLDAINSNENMKNVGVETILPPTHTGSPRWYTEKYQDAMAIVRKFGKPDYFITMTASADWPELTESLFPGESSHDRPDLIARIFNMKANELIKDLEHGGILGKVIAILVVTEWQKRGLPHIHMLLFVHPDDKPRSPEDIDKVTCAEIPDEKTNPLLHKLVKEKMMHGPCHGFNPLSPCLLNPSKKCEKKFPKPYTEKTTTEENGRTVYRRRHFNDGGHLASKKVGGKKQLLGNNWVVPYNPYLLLKYKCHINVEVCTTTSSVKYIFKYVLKGSDKISFDIKNSKESDEIEKNEVKFFEHGRYIESTQSCHRIFEFPICYRYPPVLKLHLHLEGEQTVIIEKDEDPRNALQRFSKTTLTEFFELNKKDKDANEILYPDIPSYYTWQTTGKYWKKRAEKLNERECDDDDYNDDEDNKPLSGMIGRIPVIALNAYSREKFFLRLLLYKVKGATSFEDLKTVTLNGEKFVCATYQEACIKRGLTEDDSAAENAMNEAFLNIKNDFLLRSFFVNLMIHYLASDPWGLFQKFKKELCAPEMREANIEEPNDQIVNDVLKELKNLFEAQNKDMAKFIGEENMPKDIPKEREEAREIVDETNFDVDIQAKIAEDQYVLLNKDQRHLVDTILEAIKSGKPGIFAVEANGGCGKTFCITTILAKLRAQGLIALAMAVTGQAATFFDRGRTIHSKLKVPIKLDASTLCSFKPNSATAKLVKRASLMVFDEYTIGHKHVYETIDRSFQNLMENDLPYGGKIILHSGDWKQILPVLQGGSRADIVEATLKCSKIWDHIQVFQLTENVRIKNAKSDDAAQYDQYLISVGEGKIETNSDIGEFMIKTPDKMISVSKDLKGFVDEIFPNLRMKIKRGLEERDILGPNWNQFVHKRAIICARNQDVEDINQICLDEMEGDEMEYLSADNCIHKKDDINFPTEFLNSLTPNSCPQHRLVLKVGAPIILMRSIDAINGHVNGAQYNVIGLGKNYIHAQLAVGPYVNGPKPEILIPKIKFLPEDRKLPFEFQRIQFPVRLGFAITSNRSQGKTYECIGIYLTRDFFTHGQLYVALSRVGSANHVKIFKPKSSPSFGFMKNVVYQEVLSLNIQSLPSPTQFSDSSLKESKPLFPLFRLDPFRSHSFADQKNILTIPRLDDVGFELRKPLTPEDGNCFIHAALDQMRYVYLEYIIFQFLSRAA